MAFDSKVIFSKKTRFNNIEVVDEPHRRVLKFNESVQAGQAFIPSDLPIRPGFHRAWQFNSSISNIVEVGLGVGLLAKSILNAYPQTQIDIVEIDEDVFNVAQEHFGFSTNSQIRVHIADGRIFLDEIKNKYDAVFIDAYISKERSSFIPFQLITKEAFESVRAALSDDGIFVVHNVDRDRERLKFLSNQIAQTMSTVFPYVYFENSANGRSHDHVYATLKPWTENTTEILAFSPSSDHLIFTDEVMPENKVLMPYWVREQLSLKNK